MDPLAEKFYSWSGYNYVYNNPLKFIDPDGTSPDNTIFYDEDGNELYRTKDNLDDAIVVINKENKVQFDKTIMGAVLSPSCA